MGGGSDGGTARRLIAFGAAALAASLIFRALAGELDLEPIWILLIAWAVLTAGFVGTVLLRARRERTAEEQEDAMEDR